MIDISSVCVCLRTHLGEQPASPTAAASITNSSRMSLRRSSPRRQQNRRDVPRIAPTRSALTAQIKKRPDSVFADAQGRVFGDLLEHEQTAGRLGAIARRGALLQMQPDTEYMWVYVVPTASTDRPPRRHAEIRLWSYASRDPASDNGLVDNEERWLTEPEEDRTIRIVSYLERWERQRKISSLVVQRI